MYHHVDLKEVVATASGSTTSKILDVWQKANVPASDSSYVKKKILKLFSDFKGIKKLKDRMTETEVTKRGIFKDSLEEVFDVAHANALTSNIPEEDKEFLRSQREDRMSSSMAGVDQTSVKKQERAWLKRKREIDRRETEAAAVSTMRLEKDVILETSSESSSSTESDDDTFLGPTPAKVQRLHRPANKLNKEMTLSWDRDNLSVRAATSSFAAAAIALGHNIDELTLSRSSVHRARVKNREEIAASRSWDTEVPLVLHWDGKLLPNITNGKSLEERIAVLVTGEDTEELLGVPVSADGTGRAVAETVFKLVRENDLETRIIGMGFDTTASNTGLVKGACARIERELNRPLLWLACRHHVYEVVLQDVFQCCYGPSSGPDIALFKKLQARWPLIDQSKVRPLDADSLSAEQKTRRQSMTNLLRQLLGAGSHPREDYQELIQLCLVFLGGDMPKYFRAPGAYHMARWMAKGIYAIKITLFADQLKLTSREKEGMMKVSMFVAMVYIKYWNEATIAAHAPKNDSDFIRDLADYEDRSVAAVADRAMRRHLWYMSDDLIGLALFDERVDEGEKIAIVQAMKTQPALKVSSRRLQGKNLNLQRPLSTWATVRSSNLIKGLLGDQTFLDENVTTWPSNPLYQLAQKRVATLRVSNDVAERGIALVKRFLGRRTKSEEQTQFLLQAVPLHTRAVPRKTKEQLKTKVIKDC